MCIICEHIYVRHAIGCRKSVNIVAVYMGLEGLLAVGE